MVKTWLNFTQKTKGKREIDSRLNVRSVVPLAIQREHTIIAG